MLARPRRRSDIAPSVLRAASPPLMIASLSVALLACTAPKGGTTEPGGLAGEGVRADGSPRASGTDTAPRPPPQGAGLDEATAQAEADAILEEVAKARGLSLKSEVAVTVTSKKQIRAYARENMYEHTTPEELALQGRISGSLGVISKQAGLEQILLDLLEDGVLGFYDPKKKTLYIGDFVSPALLSQVVGHEIAHGLQDMHFDLDARMKPNLHHADADEAQRFVIEGGAQAAYLAWVSGSDGLGAIDDAVLDAMVDQSLELAGMGPNPILARGLHLPYTAGTGTIIRLVREQGWGAVDKLYASMPETTEQMLHIDKLLAREPAREVTLDHAAIAAALGDPVVWHDQIGEATLLTMLADVEPSTIAIEAAAGWGGDAMVALESSKDGPTAVVMVVAWDTESDAQAFETSMRKYTDERVGGSNLVSRKGDAVVVVTGLPEDSAGAPTGDIDKDVLARELWAAVRVQPLRGSRKGRR